MAYLKPQAPLQNGDDYVYPITTADQVVATDGTHRLNNELNEIREETAVIESSSTSSHAYAVGKFLTYNGILYRVTTAIAIGDTLTPGTNITATNVGDQLKSLNDSLSNSITPQAISSYTKTSQTNYRITSQIMYRIGGLMYVKFTAEVASTYGQNPGINVFTGLPLSKVSFSQIFPSWSNVSTGLTLRVYVVNDVIALRNGDNNQTYDVVLVYPLA